MLTDKDRTILRELAKRQREYAHLPVMEERTQRWYNHNDLVGDDVLIHFETWTFISEIMPPLQTSTDFARGVEWALYHNILNHELIEDDRVVPKTYDIGWQTGMVPFDVDINVQQTDGVGYQFIHPIHDLEEDFDKLKPSRIYINREETLKQMDILQDILGDILPVRLSSGSLGGSLSHSIIRLMGMESMYLSFADYPELLLEMMNRLTEDTLRYYRTLEAEGLLLLNNGNDGLGQGSFGFSRTLPGGETPPVETRHLWGYMDSQETEGISPECFGTFFFPYFAKIAAQYGLLSYGCCEPVHLFWEQYLSKLPNLRKVSISPWCDEAFMGAALRGTQTIYHRKPSPNYVGVGAVFDEEGFKQHILNTLQAARGCKLEFSFRDVYTLTGDINKPRRAVQIVRDLLSKHWG